MSLLTADRSDSPIAGAAPSAAALPRAQRPLTRTDPNRRRPIRPRRAAPTTLARPRRTPPRVTESSQSLRFSHHARTGLHRPTAIWVPLRTLVPVATLFALTDTACSRKSLHPSCDSPPSGPVVPRLPGPNPSTPPTRPQPSVQPLLVRCRRHRNPVRHAHRRHTAVRDAGAVLASHHRSRPPRPVEMYRPFFIPPLANRLEPAESLRWHLAEARYR